MPYREKSPWISLTAQIVVFGIYFAFLIHVWEFPGRGQFGVAMLVGALIALAAIAGVLRIVTAIASPKEANTPVDDRKWLISLKAERIALYLLSACVVGVMGVLLLHWNSFLVANLLLGAMVLSELAKAITQVAGLRGSA